MNLYSKALVLRGFSQFAWCPKLKATLNSLLDPEN